MPKIFKVRIFVISSVYTELGIQFKKLGVRTSKQEGNINNLSGS